MIDTLEPHPELPGWVKITTPTGKSFAINSTQVNSVLFRSGSSAQGGRSTIVVGTQEVHVALPVDSVLEVFAKAQGVSHGAA